MRFAAIQLSSQADVPSNLSAARVEVERAKRAGAEVVLLPEGFAFLGAETDKAKVAECLGPDPREDGPIAAALRGWSQEFGIVVVGGGLPEASSSPERPYNTSAVFARGELIARYRKIHLFDVELTDGTRLFESAGNSAGDDVVTLDMGPLKVGLAICYDLRFPELFADLRRRGSQVILLSAAFTRTTGQAHWHTLLRARAIETQCYVVASAQFGEHPRDRRTFGHSLIIDPWGEVVGELADGAGAVVADLDPARVQSVRTQMPLEKHRRLC